MIKTMKLSFITFLLCSTVLCDSSTGTESTVSTVSTTAASTSESTTASSTVSTSESTTASSTSESTTVPSTTSGTTPTPTDPPAPLPTKPEVGNFNVTVGNTTCILLKMAASFSIPYSRTDKKNDTATINVLKTANVTGNCGNDTQVIVLSFGDVNATRKLTISFAKDNKSDPNTYNISQIQLDYFADSTTFPDHDGPAKRALVLTNLNNGNNAEMTKVGNSFECKSNQSFAITQSGTKDATLTLSNAQYEAYRTAKGGSFSTGSACAADAAGTSNIVPIAVGCALAALVVIVIIAYLIGRRRAKTKGYQSM